MKIDAAVHIQRPLLGDVEMPQTAHAVPAGKDTVNLSSLAAGDDGAVTSQTAGLITNNAGEALAAHSRLDPERALRLLGLLE